MQAWCWRLFILSNIPAQHVLSLGSFLQADRLRRMMGDEVGHSSQSQIHMSADDLNDGFILDKEDKKTLSYQVNRLVSD